MLEETLAYAREHREPFLKDLFDLLAIPSVSAQPAHTKDVRMAALWLAEHLRNIGLKAEVKETSGHPVVYGEWLGAGPNKPTLLIYGHYDVQPAEPFELWTTDAFTPTVRDGYIFARGSCDNKGQHMAHVKAIESYLKGSGALPVNVKFLIEGEEEIGGPSLTAFIEANTELLACDGIMISDGSLLAMDQPTLTYGLRGIVRLEVTVRALDKDVHSGMYGGNVQNAAVALAQIIAKLKDEQGRVTVPGFYDEVRTVDAAELAELERVPYTAKEVLSETGAMRLFGDPDFTLPERKGSRPTLEINGMWSGYTGPGGKTIIPATAHAKITCRMVPFMTPHKIAQQVAAYIQQVAPAATEVRVELFDGTPGLLIERESPFVTAAAQAAQETYGNPPIFELEGGSIPVVGDFQKLLGKPIILLGFGLNDDNVHSPNERYALACWEKGIEASIRFLAKL